MRQSNAISKARRRWNEIYEGDTERLECTLQIDENMPPITELFKENHVKRVLDLGCGAGRHTVYLAQQGFDTSGIDISGEGIKKAKQRLAERGLAANFTVGSMTEKLPYKDNFFDAMISTRTIHHAKIEIIRKIIKDIERVLKPHGLIFITVPKKRWRKPFSHYKEIATRTYLRTEGKEAGVAHYYFNKELLRSEFRNFEIYNIWVDKNDGYCILGWRRMKIKCLLCVGHSDDEVGYVQCPLLKDVICYACCTEICYGAEDTRREVMKRLNLKTERRIDKACGCCELQWVKKGSLVKK